MVRFRQVKLSEKIAKEESVPMEHKDYSLKEGQKIKISLNVSQTPPSLLVQEV